MEHSFILGGTKGLGLALAHESYRRGVKPIITGSSVGRPGWSPECFPPEHIAMNVNLTRFGTLVNFETFRPYDIPYFFWVAGIHLKKSLREATLPEMNRMIDVHFRTPMELIKGFHATRQSPYHLVVIASTSSWRLREHETIYCALKAAKAAFARNFARELAGNLPGSKVTLVNPGGLATPNFWAPLKPPDGDHGAGGQDISRFMDPSVVAGIIWDKVQSQKKLYRELQIMRRDDGTPRITYGPRTPETP